MVAKKRSMAKELTVAATDITVKRKAASGAARAKKYREAKKAAATVAKLNLELPKPIFEFYVQLCKLGDVAPQQFLVLLLERFVREMPNIKKLAEKYGIEF